MREKVRIAHRPTGVVMRAEGERTGAYCAVIWVGVGAYLGLPSVGRIGQVYSLCPGGDNFSYGRKCVVNSEK